MATKPPGVSTTTGEALEGMDWTAKAKARMKIAFFMRNTSPF
jgi:hypothetical protein